MLTTTESKVRYHQSAFLHMKRQQYANAGLLASDCTLAEHANALYSQCQSPRFDATSRRFFRPSSMTPQWMGEPVESEMGRLPVGGESEMRWPVRAGGGGGDGCPWGGGVVTLRHATPLSPATYTTSDCCQGILSTSTKLFRCVVPVRSRYMAGGV